MFTELEPKSVFEYFFFSKKMNTTLCCNSDNKRIKNKLVITGNNNRTGFRNILFTDYSGSENTSG